MKNTTIIRTTANLFSHKERIEHISKMAKYVEENTVEFICNGNIYYYEFINNEWIIIVNIKFKSIDDFNRPVFKDVNSNTYYGDLNAEYYRKTDNISEFYKDNIHLLEYFGTRFNCEPHGGLYPKIKLNIVS